MDEERFEDLLEQFTSPADIESALREKKAGGPARRAVGEIIKDYPDVQDTLDLHEKNKQEANLAIKRFIRISKERGLKTIRIISGKGTGVIKKFTSELLTALRQQKYILHFKGEKRTASFVVYL